MIDEICLFQNTDTCYFFLIKIADARKKSLRQIHDDNLYNRWYTTKKNNYKYDRKIRYKQVQWWENGFIKYSRSPNRKKNERIWS